jgi:drug/metabolite transporter (DMT)-like permease
LIFLFITIPLIFAFSHLFKYAQVKQCESIPVITVNYTVVSIILLGYHGVMGLPELSKGMIVLGVATGFVFISALTIYTKGLEIASVNMCMLSFRLSIVVPIVFAVAFWSEEFSLKKVIGLILCLISFAFISMTRDKSVPKHRFLYTVIALIFFAQGAAQVCTEAVHFLHYDEASQFILMLITSTATILGFGILRLNKKKIAVRELKMGATIGIVNVVCLVMILKSLSVLPAAIFWPVSSSSLVVLDILAAKFLWHERIGSKVIIGGCFAVASIYIILSK